MSKDELLEMAKADVVMAKADVGHHSRRPIHANKRDDKNYPTLNNRNKLYAEVFEDATNFTKKPPVLVNDY